MGSKKNAPDYNPFPGLRPFNPEESDLFFGREKESREVLEKLLKNHFITVTGPSGTGKSSLVYCGVLPELKKRADSEANAWEVIAFRPGNDPLTNLGQAILEGINKEGRQKAALENILLDIHLNDNGIASALKKYFIKRNEKVLLVIDEFEELFRYKTTGAKVSRGVNAVSFVEKIVSAASQPDSNIYIIITMRSDYVGECSYYQGLTEMINNSSYLIPVMNRNVYREVIEGPVQYAGATIDPTLVETILDDIADQADQLPVLQHTLMRTWACWRKMNEPGRAISIEDYEAAGKMSEAMSKHANEAFEELDERGKEICEKLFRTITEKGLDNRDSRRPSSIRTIKSIIPCSTDELVEVVDKFRSPSRSFITPGQHVQLNDDSIIDLSHEGLMRIWDRLKVWVDEEAASVNMYMNLSEASAMYQLGKTGLLKNAELQLALNWRDSQKPTLAWAERYEPAFERVMVYLRTSEKQHLDEEEIDAMLHRKKLRRTKFITTILGTTAFFAIVFMVIAFIQKLGSDRQALIAEQIKEETEIQKNRADSSAQAALEQRTLAVTNAALAEQRAEEARKEKAKTEREKQVAELNAIMATKKEKIALDNEMLAKEQSEETKRLRMLAIGRSMSLKSLQMNGRKDLQALLAYQAYLFNKRYGGFENDADIFNGLYNVAVQYGNKDYKSFIGHKGQVTGIAFVPGKSEFFTAGDDGQVLKWSLDGQANTFQVVYSDDEIIDVLAVSPDASWLACGNRNSSIRMIPLKGNNVQYELKGHNGEIKSLIFSFDGKYLYSAAMDGKVLKWDMATRTSRDVTTGEMKITSIDLSSNGNYLAGISSSGNVILWDPDDKTDNYPIETSLKNITAIRFKPDDNTLALGDVNGNVELWDISTRKKISAIKANESQINDIQFNPLSGQMATASNDKTLKVFDMKNMSEPPITFTDTGGFVLAIQFSPDGQLIVSGGYEPGRNLVSRPVNTASLVKNICSLISRNMTQDEWDAYVAKDIPPEQTCSDRSFNIKVNVVQ